MRLRLLGCAALLFTGVAQADDGVPALLQFAEQYQRQNTAPKSENAAPADREAVLEVAERMDTGSVGLNFFAFLFFWMARKTIREESVS